MLKTIKILYHQGKQYIPDLTKAKVPGIFRGRPEISLLKVDENELAGVCPTGAILSNPVRIDLGKCTFCNECVKCFPEKIRFTTDHKIAVNDRSRLIVAEGSVQDLAIDMVLIRAEIRRLFKGSLKLRQV